MCSSVRRLNSIVPTSACGSPWCRKERRFSILWTSQCATRRRSVRRIGIAQLTFTHTAPRRKSVSRRRRTTGSSCDSRSYSAGSHNTDRWWSTPWLRIQNASMVISRGQVRANEVWFTHEPLAPMATYRNHFNAVLRFGQSMNGLLFSQEDLDLPVPDTDPQLYEIATSLYRSSLPELCRDLEYTGSQHNCPPPGGGKLHARACHRCARPASSHSSAQAAG